MKKFLEILVILAMVFAFYGNAMADFFVYLEHDTQDASQNFQILYGMDHFKSIKIRDGQGVISDDKDQTLSFMTREYLDAFAKEKTLYAPKVASRLWPNSHPGIYLVIWHKENKEGLVFPVEFSPMLVTINSKMWLDGVCFYGPDSLLKMLERENRVVFSQNYDL